MKRHPVDQTDIVVIPITGTGFKDPEVVLKKTTHYEAITPNLRDLSLLLSRMK